MTNRRSLLKSFLATGAVAGGAVLAGKTAVGGRVAATAPGTSPCLAPLAAISSRLMADADLMARLPGGVWHRFAPRGSAYPNAVFDILFAIEDSEAKESHGILNFYVRDQHQGPAIETSDLAQRTIAKGPYKTSKGVMVFPPGFSEHETAGGFSFGGSSVYCHAVALDFLISR